MHACSLSSISDEEDVYVTLVAVGRGSQLFNVGQPRPFFGTGSGESSSVVWTCTTLVRGGYAGCRSGVYGVPTSSFNFHYYFILLFCQVIIIIIKGHSLRRACLQPVILSGMYLLLIEIQEQQAVIIYAIGVYL